MKVTSTQMSKPKKVPYGYYVDEGYVGYVPDLARYILFATENEYLDYIKEGE